MIHLRALAQRIRVPAGFAMAPLFVIAARPTSLTLIAGAVIALTGLALRAWASGHLKKNQELATRGPYAHTRNPLYFGTLLLGAGVAVGTGALWFVALFIALYLLIYVPVMFAEADTVRELFPGEYEHYSRNVPLFLPRITPYQASSSEGIKSIPGARKGFDLKRYLHHREYRAGLGFVIVYALLLVKFFLSTGG